MAEPARELEVLRLALRHFAAERGWERFHSPKNLATAMLVEAAEVAEHFQWRTEVESAALDDAARAAVAMELADVLLYLVRLADKLDIDLAAAAREKMTINEERFPARTTGFDG